MFSVAICDDNELVCTEIEKVLEPYKDKIATEIFYSAEKLYDGMCNGDWYDLIFLDIEFQKMSGIDLAYKIRQELNNEKTHIVYISVEKGHALSLFATRPLNFIVKPISEKDIIDNVQKAMELADENKQIFQFKVRTETRRIPYGDILFFESAGRKIRIHAVNGMYETYSKLDEIESVAPIGFTRIHKSYIINDIYVMKWMYDSVMLTSGESLSISRNYRRQTRHKLLQGR